MRIKRSLILVIAGLGLGLSAGCAVPQPRGQGLCQYLQEPTTKSWYYLYLPVDYIRNGGQHPDPKVKRWPLVMTFHGMKPYDTAPAQEREWEQQADIYGYIVCAPELWSCDSFMEYPLTKEHSYVLRDKQSVIAIMSQVFATTRADPERVLSTSWSCGGYLAHYFPNRFPEKFSCIATRLSNFSSKLMVDETVPRYRDKTWVAIFAGDGDLPACKIESEEGVAWYTARKFRTVRGKMIDNMGHRRIPQVAAAFFAEQLSIEPLRPLEAAQTVAQVQMTDYYPPQELIARMSPRVPIGELGPALAVGPPSPAVPGRSPGPAGIPPRAVAYESMTAGRDYPVDRTPVYDPTPERGAPRANPASLPAAPPTGAGAARAAPAPAPRTNWLEPAAGEAIAPKPAPGRSGPANPPAKPEERVAQGGPAAPKPSAAPGGSSAYSSPAGAAWSSGSTARRVNVRLSGPAIGTAPHYIAYSVDLPREVLEGADCLWMDNGVWIGDEPRGVKILESPGQHRITVLVVNKDNIEYRGSATVYVLDRGSVASTGSPTE